jgi:hypothetical protein
MEVHMLKTEQEYQFTLEKIEIICLMLEKILSRQSNWKYYLY